MCSQALLSQLAITDATSLCYGEKLAPSTHGPAQQFTHTPSDVSTILTTISTGSNTLE